MTSNTKDSCRLDGTQQDPDGGERMAYGGLLPDDFTDRLDRLKQASGLATNIGVDYKQMYRWRKGVEPSGGAMHALYRYASRIPGGLQILMGDGFQMTFFDN